MELMSKLHKATFPLRIGGISREWYDAILGMSFGEMAKDQGVDCTLTDFETGRSVTKRLLLMIGREHKSLDEPDVKMAYMLFRYEYGSLAVIMEVIIQIDVLEGYVIGQQLVRSEFTGADLVFDTPPVPAEQG